MTRGDETRRHRIGIIAGSGPEAGIDMWRKVLQEHRAALGSRYRGDIDAPETVIVSLPELGYSMDLEHQEARVWNALEGAARRVAEQADVFVIACNTLNHFADRLRDLQLPAVLLTPVDAALAEIERRGLTRVALLGSRQTMDLDGWSSYRGLRDRVQLELPEDRERLHRLIESVKLEGGSSPELEEEFASLRRELDSDTVLLACTELPLLHGHAASEESGAIDVSRLLARAAVNWAPPAAVESPGPVAVLYTGGTFGMTPTPRGLAPNPHLDEELAKLVARMHGEDAAAPRWTYHETPRAIDSAELQPAGMGHLADSIRTIVQDGSPAGVVVVHGTDTMAYSAAHAAFALADLSLPIVFTGAQLPLGTPGSDAEQNFSDAFDAARRGTDAGVSIAFGGRMLPAVRTVKRSSESLDAFAAPRLRAPQVQGADEELRTALRAAIGRPAPRVGLVKVSPGLTAAQLRAVLEECPAGVVLECYGAGTAPVGSGGLAPVIRSAVDRGTAVVAVTQCEDGSVELSRYAVGSALADAGVLPGGDMTTEAALGKLGALLRAGLSGAGLAAALGRNLLGERTPSGA
ncbi:asparaginase domain-containing protein [uncultured Microbacterium sp.]|mgnify:CR=1 FL=1|uniref:asparaginase domain-containing protein n=1 Tax=uncultured Microbacterium sp. TaxID=191216 RepID=UPI002615A4D8|nr:asparaginase domain-containing protein [uncultured Microbacterium sp.]